MPTFVKYKSEWYRWDRDTMKLFNIRGGHTTIDENSMDWVQAVTAEADNWYELCTSQHWYPLMADYTMRDGWISPAGECFKCEAHAVAAPVICQVYYPPEEVDEALDMDLADDFLIQKGWIKVTTSYMYGYYISDSMYAHITAPQKEILTQWANHHGETFPW